MDETPPKRRKTGSAAADPESTTKQPKAKAKSKAKAQPKRVITNRKCKGCHKKVTPELQAPNWPGCWPCKRALDNIAKAAAKQGDKAIKFVAEARQDDAKCYNMIQSYLENCPETQECAGKKRGVWSVVRYIERVVAASGLVKDAVGELMWEKLWLEFAQTVRGGRLREEEAALKWKEWEEAVERKDPKNKIHHDFQGPNGKLRVWVKTKDTLTYRSEYMHEKGVDCVGQEIKKGTDADVDKFRPEMFKNHGKNMNFDEVAPALCKNGMDAFQSSDGSGFLLDVLDLQKDVDEEELEPSENGEKPAGSGSDAPAKPWIERDRMVSAAIRTARAQTETFVEKGCNLHKRLSEWKA
eukprot:Skav228410  [mRNA]  locus=scaffold3824:318780:319841:- [translate_table: standard]